MHKPLGVEDLRARMPRRTGQKRRDQVAHFCDPLISVPFRHLRGCRRQRPISLSGEVRAESGDDENPERGEHGREHQDVPQRESDPNGCVHGTSIT